MFNILLSATLFSASFRFTNAGIGPSSTLTVANKRIAPDGFERPSVLVNGVYPAPLISANKGDAFRLNVVNSLTDPTMLRSTSIHWHGFYQHGSSWADGPTGVTQCPIAPNNSFLYQFSSTDQAGTFWYHSHFGTQYCDGLRGPLVVYDPSDPQKLLYDVDDDSTVITLGEWYHLQAPSMASIAIADTTLINGKGRYPGGPLVDLAILNVEHGKRYRFRLVSISCDPNYIFSVDGHSLTIIEADGQHTQPLTVDSLRILAGQRYSFVLSANQPVANYWVRALPNTGNRELASGFGNGTNSAILRYLGAPLADPTSQPMDDQRFLQEADLHPLCNPSATDVLFGEADVKINLALDFDPNLFHYTVNGVTFRPVSTPVLLQITSGAKSPQELLPNGSVFTLPRNKVIELTIPGGVRGGPHPFHLHGHSFSVVRSAGVDAKTNLINPVRRDVVSLGDVGSNVTIRFQTDNAGPWLFHCHIDWHIDLGLAVVFAEDTADVKEETPVPASWENLCPVYDALPASMTSVQIVPAPN